MNIKPKNISARLIVLIALGLTLTAFSQTLPQTPLKAKQLTSSSPQLSAVLALVEPSIVIVEDASGKNFLGFCYENGTGSLDEKDLKSSWIVTNSIESKKEIYVRYKGMRIKAVNKFTDVDADVSILFLDNTVVKKGTVASESELSIDKTRGYFATNLSDNKITLNAVNLEKTIKLNDFDFFELTSKSSIENLSGGLFDSSGRFFGLLPRKNKSDVKSLLAMSSKNTQMISDAQTAATIIKLLALDEKYHSQYGDDFAKWLYSSEDRKYLQMYKDASKTFSTPNANQNLDERFKDHQKKLFDIAMVFFNNKNMQSTTSKNVQKNVSLVCRISTEYKTQPQQMSFVIDFNTQRVNGNNANIGDSVITFSYMGGDNTFFNVRIDRIGGHVTLGTSQFPTLASGPCSKVEERAF
jgi:hypothetical protein